MAGKNTKFGRRRMIAGSMVIGFTGLAGCVEQLEDIENPLGDDDTGSSRPDSNQPQTESDESDVGDVDIFVGKPEPADEIHDPDEDYRTFRIPVENRGTDPSSNVPLTLSFYDADGTLISDGWESLQTLGAGETWMATTDAPTETADLSADYTGDATPLPRLEDVTVREHELLGVDRFPNDEVIDSIIGVIHGTVANQREEAIDRARVVAKFYDSEGRVLITHSDRQRDVPPETDWNFEIRTRREPEYFDSYELVVITDS